MRASGPTCRALRGMARVCGDREGKAVADPESLFATVSDVVVSVSLALAGATDDQLDAVIDESLDALTMRASADRAYTKLYSNETFSNSHEWVAAESCRSATQSSASRLRRFRFRLVWRGRAGCGGASR